MEDAVAAIIVFTVIGSFTMMGLRMFFKYRIERLKGGASEAVKRLEEAMTALREDVYLLRTDMGDMQERLDFAERLLTRGGQPKDRLPDH